MTPDEAVENAVRLLRAAEGETDREMMARYESLAQTWLAMADLLVAAHAED